MNPPIDERERGMNNMRNNIERRERVREGLEDIGELSEEIKRLADEVNEADKIIIKEGIPSIRKADNTEWKFEIDKEVVDKDSPEATPEPKEERDQGKSKDNQETVDAESSEGQKEEQVYENHPEEEEVEVVASPDSEKTEAELGDTEKESQPEQPKKPVTLRNEVEANPKKEYGDFDRLKVAEMLRDGASDEEIWQASKEHGFFFKFDGSSYYLGDNDKWRHRSAEGNTHTNIEEEEEAKEKVLNELDKYRQMEDWFGSYEDAFVAANALYVNEIPQNKTDLLNKMGQISASWEDIKKDNKDIRELVASALGTPDDQMAENINTNDENLSDKKDNIKKDNMSPEKSGVPKDQEREDVKRPEDSAAETPENQESTEGIKEGDLVRYLDDGGSKVKEAVRVTDTKVEDGKTFISFDGGKKYYQFAEYADDPNSGLNKIYSESNEEEAENSTEDRKSAEGIKAGDKVHWKNHLGERSGEKIVAEIKGSGEDAMVFFEDDSRGYPISEVYPVDNEKTEESDIVPDAENATQEEVESNEVLSKFESRFGISTEALESIDGFPQGKAEQRWILENLTQLTMGMIESEGEKRREKALDASIPDEWKSDAGGRLKNFFNKVKIGFTKLQEGVETKNHTVSFKQQILEEIENGGIKEHGSTIKELINSLNESDFGVKINEETDELEYDFVSMPEAATEAQAEVIQNYNEVATKMANTPREWQYDSATKSQRKQYEGAKADYDEARKELATLKLDHGELKGDDLAVAQYLNEKDFGVEMNQLLNTNPELGEEIEDISNQSVWWQTIKGGFNQKNAVNALIGVGGAATRWATASATFGIGAVASGAAVGSLRGKLEAGRKIRQKEKDARYGGIDNIPGIEDLTTVRDQITATEEEIAATDDDKQVAVLKERRRELLEKRDELVQRKDIRQKLYEAGAIVNAGDLIEKLERDISLVEDSDPESNQRENRLGSLDARVQYVVNKLDQGIVNFGANSADIASAKMNLMKLLSQAEVTTETYGDEWGAKVFDEWVERVDLKNQEEIEQARKAFTRKEMAKAAGVSAAFFGTGYGLRWAGETLGWWGGDSVEILADSPEISEGPPGGQVPDSTVEASPLSPAAADSADADTTGANPFVPDLETAPAESTSTDTSSLEEINFPDADSTAVDSTTADSVSTEATAQEENPLESNLETAAADSTNVDTTEASESVAASAAAETDVNPEVIGVREVVIDEQGEGMIHAIADKLEDDFDLPRDKAMRIGNEMYIKGEQAGEDSVERMYNLIGRDASFSLDFGDLTAEDLEGESVEDLAERINFSNESVDSDLKEFDLPKQESAAAGASDSSDNPYYGEKNPIDTKDIDSVTINEANQQAWDKQMDESGVIRGDDLPEGAREDADMGRAPAPERVDIGIDKLKAAVAESDVRDQIYADLDQRVNAARMNPQALSEGMRVSDLAALRDYMQANPDQNLIVSIDAMREGDRRMLRTLDLLIESKANEPGSVLEKVDRYISTGIGDMTIEADAAPESVQTPDEGGDIDAVRKEMEEAGTPIDEEPEIEVRTSAAAVSDGLEALKTEVDQIPSDKLQAMATHMSAQAYVEPEFINVPSERLEALENYLEENATRSTSGMIQKMSEESPETITAFERVMNLDDSGDIVDRKSLRPVYKMTQKLISNLTEENFPGGIPEYARESLEASRSATQA